MKYMIEKYPFISLLAENKFDEINFHDKELGVNLEFIKRIRFKDVELQTASQSMLFKGIEIFGDDLFNFFEKLKPCAGMLLTGNKCGVYYEIDPLGKFRNFLIMIFHGKEVVSVWETYFKYTDLTTKQNFCSNPGKSLPYIKTDWSANFYSVLILNLLHQFAKTEVVVLGGGKNPKKLMIGGVKFMSDFPVPINHYDCSWFREIIIKAEIGVRPYFRLQPCGIGKKEYRLVLVKAHVRHGLHRKAKKDL
jgi:hypothetical protein